MSTETPSLEANTDGDTLVRPRGDAPIGGQAVLEGVMMRGVSTWAVAVRKPTPEQLEREGGHHDPTTAAEGEIEVVSEPLVSIVKRHRVLRLPIIRGVAALVESLRIGFKALGISANAQLEEDEQEIGGGAWVGTVVLSVLLAVGLFFLLPVGITSLLRDQLPNSVVFVIVEKLIRISIFLAYLWLISRMRDLQRVFEYHGAEHKTISCYEAGLPLTPENAQRLSRLRPKSLITSNAMPATSGMPSTREANSQYQAGVPSGANTKMATTMTIKRKLVPQRGWSREKRCAFSGVSGRPAS